MMKFPVYESSTQKRVRQIEDRILRSGKLEMDQLCYLSEGKRAMLRAEKLTADLSYHALLMDRGKRLMEKQEREMAAISRFKESAAVAAVRCFVQDMWEATKKEQEKREEKEWQEWQKKLFNRFVA